MSEMMSDTPVLDTILAMTADSLERCSLPADMLILTRIAALAAMDAPVVSYAAHVEPGLRENVSSRQLQDVLVAIAPIVGTARVMAAATRITAALGIAIAVADMNAGAQSEEHEQGSRSDPADS